LALALPCPQLDGTVGLGGSPIGKIGMIGIFLLQDFERLARLAQNITLPVDQLCLEVQLLTLIHERLVFRGNVIAFNEVAHRLTPLLKNPALVYSPLQSRTSIIHTRLT